MPRGDENTQRFERFSDESRSAFVAHRIDADEKGAATNENHVVLEPVEAPGESARVVP
jgi:hypothetical protein